MRKTEGIHKDHRKRLREKVSKNGLKSLAKHEILEFLLTYAIPRKDTNPLAHDLINTFGGLSEVFKANLKDLELVKGVGKTTAIFLKSLYEFIEIYQEEESKSKKYKLGNTQNCVQYFRENFIVSNSEEFILICLRSNLSVSKVVRFNEENSIHVIVDSRKLTHEITSNEVSAIVLYHTHPNGEVEPTIEDVEATKKIVKICKAIGIRVVDHIIFNETSHYSFKFDQPETIE